MRRRHTVMWLGPPIALFGVSWLVGVRVNLTASLPIGLYVTSRAPPARGTLVLVCLPERVAAFASTRGYVPRGGSCPGRVVPVGKQVVALPGDTVRVTPAGLCVNGTPVPNSRALARDRRGRTLPRLALGRYVVGPSALWIASPYSRLSFDSRYFGAVELSAVRATVRPVWTSARTSDAQTAWPAPGPGPSSGEGDAAGNATCTETRDH